MFNKKDLQKLIKDENAFQKIQDEANNPNAENHLQSKLRITLCQIYGIGVKQDLAQGFDKIFDIYFAEKEYSNDAFNVLKSKPFSEKELESVFSHYNTISTNSGLARTQKILGTCYQLGFGVAKDIREAFGCFDMAAELGDTWALNKLAACYQNGVDVPKNMIKAIGYYQKAANLGDTWAQCILGYFYEKGVTVSRNEHTAFGLYTMAAIQDDARGQCHLGYCYQYGIGIPKNEQKALKLYKKAIEKGYAPARKNLESLKKNESINPISSANNPLLFTSSNHRNNIISQQNNNSESKPATSSAFSILQEKSKGLTEFLQDFQNLLQQAKAENEEKEKRIQALQSELEKMKGSVNKPGTNKQKH